MNQVIRLIALLLVVSLVYSQDAASLPGKVIARDLIDFGLTQMKEAGIWRQRTKSVLSIDFPPIHGMSQDESDVFYDIIGDAFLTKIGLERIRINTLALPDITGVPIVGISMIQHEDDRFLVIVDVSRMENERGVTANIGITAYVFAKAINGTVQVSHVRVGPEVQRQR